MSIKTILSNWKFIVYPLMNFIIVFALSRCLFPLIKNWTWMATLCGFICGIIAAIIEFIKLLRSK